MPDPLDVLFDGPSAEQLLADADPVKCVTVERTSGVDVLCRVAEHPTDSDLPGVSGVLAEVRRARRRPRRAVRIGVALAIVGTISVASPVVASTWFAAQTGQVGQGGEAVEGSEWIDGQASDFEEYVMSVYPQELPLPPTVSAELFRQKEGVRMAAALSGGLAQDVLLRFTYEFAAQCMWQDEYLTQVESGSADRASHALDVLESAATWPAIVASDGGGVRDQLRSAVDAARAGDDSLIRQRFSCDSSWVVADFEVGN